MGSIPIFSTGSSTGKSSFNGFYIMPAAVLIFFVVFKCCLLPVAMARTRKIVTKHNKKRKEILCHVNLCQVNFYLVT